MGGLNALGVQQLLAASSQNTLANTLASLQSQVNASPSTSAPDLNSSGLSLAALANFNSQNIFGSLGKFCTKNFTKISLKKLKLLLRN